jgi:hypothetical protein
MSLATFPPHWQNWIASLGCLLDARVARRLEPLLLGLSLAQGRRTIASWLRAANIRHGWQGFYYAVAAVGRQTKTMAALLLRLLVQSLAPTGVIVLALDDTPTKRYGKHVQGAGLHHNPTPGPAGQALLYGHLWVTLAWIVRHQRWGPIGLPLRALLYVRRYDLGSLPKRLGWQFATKLALAGRLLRWARQALDYLGLRLWCVTDGAYAKKPFLQEARRQQVVVISRLRRDAALYSVPRPVPPERRPQGRPRTYGRTRISLAKRAGQKRGWQQVSCRQYGQEKVKRVKTFAATWRPAAGPIRVVLVKEARDWRAYFSTDVHLSAQAILEQVADRQVIEQDFHDLKDVEGTGQQQVRDVWANVGAFHLTLWAHCLTELWAWHQPHAALVDRQDSPWDDQRRRPSHADRRKALRRTCLAEGFSQLPSRQGLAREILDFVDGLIHHAA